MPQKFPACPQKGAQLNCAQKSRGTPPRSQILRQDWVNGKEPDDEHNEGAEIVTPCGQTVEPVDQMEGIDDKARTKTG